MTNAQFQAAQQQAMMAAAAAQGGGIPAMACVFSDVQLIAYLAMQLAKSTPEAPAKDLVNRAGELLIQSALQFGGNRFQKLFEQAKARRLEEVR
jgi:hypothetical protein